MIDRAADLEKMPTTVFVIRAALAAARKVIDKRTRDPVEREGVATE